MFNIYLIIYVVVVLSICAGGTYKLYGMKQSLSALIFFLGSSIVSIIFGMKWFNENGVFAKTPVSWPPVINTCPDYLTYYKRPISNNKTENTCIDTIGVSTKNFPKMVKNPSDETNPDYFFKLDMGITDPIKNKNELCKRAMEKGLTWDGITNGESCTASDGSASISPGGDCSSQPACPSGTDFTGNVSYTSGTTATVSGTPFKLTPLTFSVTVPNNFSMTSTLIDVTGTVTTSGETGKITGTITSGTFTGKYTPN